METLVVILANIFAFVEMLGIVNGSTFPLSIELSVPPLDPHKALNSIQNRVSSSGPQLTSVGSYWTTNRDQHQTPTYSSYQMPNVDSYCPYHMQSIDPYQTLSVHPHRTNFDSYLMPNFGLHQAANLNELPTRDISDFQSLTLSRPTGIEKKILSECSEYKYQNNKVYQENNAQYSISSSSSAVECYTTTVLLQ